MKFILITVGSRGDAEPFCALAEHLASAQHDVHMFLQDEHSSPSTATTHALPFTTQDFYRFVAKPKHGSDHSNPRVRFVGIVVDIIAELVLPCAKSVLEESKDAAMIVTSSLARPLAFLVGDALKIPIAVIHLQPLCPTKAFPHYSAPDNTCVDVICNNTESQQEEYEDMYWELEKFQHDFLQESLTSVRETMGLPPQDFEQLKRKLAGDDASTIIFNAYPTIIPFVHFDKSNIYNVGPIGDAYIPNDWGGAPETLTDFLKVNPQPICIGFGSMPVLQRDAVKEALAQIDRPVVVVGQAFVDDETIASNHRVLAISSAPYAWLLPRCSMMMCHGGAGVVAATLRAGIPCLVAPLMGDQFFHAVLLERRGLGIRVTENLSSMSCQDIIDAVAKVTDDMVANATRFGATIQDGKLGVAKMVDAMEAYLAAPKVDVS